jgi:hypothetical protein
MSLYPTDKELIQLHQQQQQFYQHQQHLSSQTTTTKVQQQRTVAIESTTPSYTFKSNRNGLPLVVQREIIANVKLFKGLDDFVREQCDKSPLLFGERNTQRRKAVLLKRNCLILLRDEEPKRFLELCKDFDLLVVEEVIKKKASVVSAASSTGSEDTTVKHSNVSKKHPAVETVPPETKSYIIEADSKKKKKMSNGLGKLLLYLYCCILIFN